MKRQSIEKSNMTKEEFDRAAEFPLNQEVIDKYRIQLQHNDQWRFWTIERSNLCFICEQSRADWLQAVS